MKKNKSTVFMLLFFFMGLIVLLYPSISNYYNQKVQSEAVSSYEKLLSSYKDTDYTEIFNKAYEYNKKLLKVKNPLINYDEVKNYNKILDINNNGMMGYIEIKKIGIELPIYHGTNNDVLSKAVGHIEGTSLPVGGIGTHSVLSAHRGLPSSKLFTDLDKLEIGDTFEITILNQKLTYEVDKIEIVKPTQTKSLAIDSNNDYVTLMTCTPYVINTHRLLVRGKRIENIEEKKTYVTTECYKISNIIVTPLLALPIIFSLLLMIMFAPPEFNKNEFLNQINKGKPKERR